MDFIHTYKRRAGTNAEHGHKFEIDLTILAYVRCLKLFGQGKLKSFMIAHNVDYVGDFDDVVCRIEYEENESLQTKLIFVQAKHKENPYKDENTLKSHNRKQQSDETVYIGDKPLSKYIISYLKTRKIFHEKEDCEKFTGKEKSSDESRKWREKLRNIFNCQLKDLLFIFYSNAIHVGVTYFENVKNVDHITTIFDTSACNGIYKLKLGNMTVSKIICENYKNLTEDEINRVNQFEDQFRVYLNQEKDISLEDIIKNEIKYMFNDNSNVSPKLEFIYNYLHYEIKQQFLLDHSLFLTEAQNFVENIFAMLKLQSQTTEILDTYSEWSQIFKEDVVEKLHKDLLDCKFIITSSNSLARKIRLVYFTQIVARINKSEDESKSVLFLYIKNNKFLQMWKKIRTLHSYTKYSVVFLCADIEVRSEDVHKIWISDGGRREMIISMSDDHPIFEQSLKLELSPEGINKITNYKKFHFQGFPATAKDIFGINVLPEILQYVINRVLNKENLFFGSFLPVEEKIYIERKYKKNTTILTFDVLMEKRDIFLIHRNNIDLNLLHSQKSTNVFVYENDEDAKKKYMSLDENNQNIHFCLASDIHLEVMFSKGDLKNISKYIIGQNETDEEAFLQYVLCKKITILSDDVGNGKTTSLKRLTHCIKKKYMDYWAQYIDLHSQSKNLKTWKNTVNPIEFISTNMLKLDHENQIIFQKKSYIEGNVALLFDGFDEMASEYRKEFLHFLKALSTTKIRTIVIATRTIFAFELYICIEAFSFSLLAFNYEDMASYLKQYWSNEEYNDEQKIKLTQLVSNIVEDVKENKETLTAVASVPLQMKMLASTFRDEMQIALSMKNLTNFKLGSFNLYILYNNFIDMHINRCIEEKHKLTETSNLYRTTKNMYELEAETWEALACEEIFPSMEINEIKTTDTNLVMIQQIGVIVNKYPIKFLHRSFAEFLAAKYVSRILYETKKTTILNLIYKRICVENAYVILRKFMNAFYENNRHWETAKINKKWSLGLFGFAVDDKVLMVAVKEGNGFLFKVIIRHLSKNQIVLKRILNHKTEFEENLLHFSAHYCEDVFDDILNSKYFHCAKDCDSVGKTALHVAGESGRENAVRSYLNKFRNKSLSAILDQTDRSDGHTTLLLAAKGGHTNIIKILKDHGASIHRKNWYGANALMTASEHGHIETVKYLIEQGAHINENDAFGETVLLCACKKIDKYEDGVGYIKYLVEQAGADVNFLDSSANTAVMHYVVNHDNIDIFKCLIQLGADINTVNCSGRNAVMLAAEFGRIKTLKYLFEIGVDIVNQFDVWGNTCITLCSGAKNISVLQYFIDEHKPNLDHQNFEGDTALFRAVLEDRFDNVKLLIKLGACVNICNNKGDTALTAYVHGHIDPWFDNDFLDIFFFLIQSGAEINHQNKLGNSMLHLLLNLTPTFFYKENYFKFIKLLVGLGADINLKNKESVTPAMMAQKNDNPDIKYHFKELIKSNELPA